MLTILTPIGYDEKLDTRVSNSIAVQTVECNHILEGACKRIGNEWIDKSNSIVGNRNLLLRNWEKTVDSILEPYVCMMDSDVLLSSDHDIEDMITYLELNPDVDACAFDTKGFHNLSTIKNFYHIPIAIIMIRSEQISGYQFITSPGNCECIDFNKKFRIEYVDNRKLSEL